MSGRCECFVVGGDSGTGMGGGGGVGLVYTRPLIHTHVPECK